MLDKGRPRSVHILVESCKITHIPGMPRAPKKPRRREPKQLRAHQTVEAILDAVTRILKKQGIDAVTTNRIAEVAGVSIGSVYQYFPDKRAIYCALLDRHIEQIGRVVESTLAAHADASLKKLLSAMIEAMVEAHAVETELHELLFREAPRQKNEIVFQEQMRGAWKLALLAKRSELRRPKEIDATVFVVTQIVESMAHAAILKRPARLSLATVKEETLRATIAYLQA